MKSNLKPDQVPPPQARNWENNLEAERSLTFDILVPPIFIQKETYLKLTGENEGRIRIYLGLEPEKKEGKYVLCSYAISTFLMGSGEVFRDYENPVFKLDPENNDVSSNTGAVIENIQRYRLWRNGKLDPGNAAAALRKYIYPNAYLLSKYELNEIFSSGNERAQISFGISKTMNAMVYPGIKNTAPSEESPLVFNFSHPCPPVCDGSSIFNAADKDLSDSAEKP